MSRSRHVLISLAFVCLGAAGLAGQVNITGSISDGAGGPLLSGVVYHATGSITVPAGATLTIQAGAIVKFSLGRRMTVDGQLDVLGTMAMPVILTEINDDTAGGDTNGNGPSMGTPNSWRTLQFNATATGTVSHLELRFAGRFGSAGMEISGAAVAFDNCMVSNCTAAGLDLNNIATSSTFTSCNFTNNDRAVEGVRIENVPNFTSNTASGNAQHDSLSVSSGNINSGSTTITTANMISNVIICPSISVAAGASLTLDQGCILKMNFDRNINIAGTLNCNGAPGTPVIFTSLTDDAAGGDTNKDGMATTPGPDFWRTLELQSGSAGSLLEHTEVRYAGRFGLAGVRALDDVVLRSCAVRSCTADGISLTSNVRPVIENCLVDSCGQIAYANCTWGALSGFANNQAVNNGGDYVNVDFSAVGVDDRVFAHSAPNGVVVATANPGFTATSSLILEAGVIVKMGFDRSFAVSTGHFEARGTSYAPVIITSFVDDDFGGDTNNDGPSAVAANYWRGLSVGSSALPSTLDHLWIRGGGRFGFPGLTIDNAGVQATALRADHCTDEGIQILDLAGDAENWVVDHCSKGIVLGTGTSNLIHATVADCTTAGVSATGWTGTVINSIVWNNVSNYVGIADSQILNSDGSPTAAGMNGNLHVDPLFVDPATGDYHLQAMSPCLDVADVATAHTTLVDWDEGSRLADDDLSSNVLPDMGAYEKITWSLDVQGTPSLGSTMMFTLAGPNSGFGVLLVDFAGASHEFFPDYGYLLIGLSNQVTVAATLTVNLPFSAVIPNIPTLVGFPFELQGVVLLASDPTRGNFTQRYRGKISP